MLEAPVEKYFVRQVELHGGVTRKLKWIGRKGGFDRWAMFPGWFGFVELKRPAGGKLSDHQKIERGLFRRYDVPHAILCSIEEVDAFIKEKMGCSTLSKNT